MPAYVSRELSVFVQEQTNFLVGELNQAYAADGFSQQYTTQTKAWKESVKLLQNQLCQVLADISSTAQWRVLLEFPLYRLRKRLDAVIITDQCIVVLEVKVGESAFKAADRRQVEEYGLDLRDFHEASFEAPIIPCLWCTEAPTTDFSQSLSLRKGVAPVQELGHGDLVPLMKLMAEASGPPLEFVRETWDSAAYRPVPSIVEAATALFAGHSVREIAQADASNLAESALRVVELISLAQQKGKRFLIFLTGVPGSGKTLAGLQVVHKKFAKDVKIQGDIVYISGNTSLVTVLREALVQDKHKRRQSKGLESSIEALRRKVPARIQHIIDFLKDCGVTDELVLVRPPREHTIVFDEAQRAWNEKQEQKKSQRYASEPSLLLNIMGLHQDWCALVCLIGSGQEINTREEGLSSWGDAIRALLPEAAHQWSVFGPKQVTEVDPTTGDVGLGELPVGVEFVEDEALRLKVPLRSFRSPKVSDWVAMVLQGDSVAASCIAKDLGEYPVLVTRELDVARCWLRKKGRGLRRYGLVASSGAKRLRADGLGVTLNAREGTKIAQWYLNEPGDIRASFALEVTANEYTTQGLELDFVGLCWGGDLLWSAKDQSWFYRSLRGPQWVRVAKIARCRFIKNSYRVLLTRAREGLIIWIPKGDPDDQTRDPKSLDETCRFLLECGARECVREEDF